MSAQPQSPGALGAAKRFSSPLPQGSQVYVACFSVLLGVVVQAYTVHSVFCAPDDLLRRQLSTCHSNLFSKSLQAFARVPSVNYDIVSGRGAKWGLVANAGAQYLLIGCLLAIVSWARRRTPGVSEKPASTSKLEGRLDNVVRPHDGHTPKFNTWKLTWDALCASYKRQVPFQLDLLVVALECAFLLTSLRLVSPSEGPGPSLLQTLALVVAAVVVAGYPVQAFVLADSEERAEPRADNTAPDAPLCVEEDCSDSLHTAKRLAYDEVDVDDKHRSRNICINKFDTYKKNQQANLHSCSLSLAQKLVQGGGQTAYHSKLGLRRIAIKIPSALPTELPSQWQETAQRALTKEGIHVHALYVRAGCIQLVLDVALPDGGAGDSTELPILHSLLGLIPQQILDRQQQPTVVQLQELTFHLNSGKLSQCPRSAQKGPRITGLATPCILTPQQRTVLKLNGENLEGAVFYLRQGGAFVAAQAMVNDGAAEVTVEPNVLLPGLLTIECEVHGLLSNWVPVVCVENEAMCLELRNLVEKINCAPALARAREQMPVDVHSLLCDLAVCLEAAGGISGVEEVMQPVFVDLLHFLCEQGCVASSTALVKRLVVAGYPLERPSARTDMCLPHVVVCSGRPEMVQTLINWGQEYRISWDWQKLCSSGVSPLHLAAVVEDGGQIAKLMLTRIPGVRRPWLFCLSADGKTPADFADMAGNGHVNTMARQLLAPVYGQTLDALQASIALSESDADSVPSSCNSSSCSSCTKHALPPESTPGPGERLSLSSLMSALSWRTPLQAVCTCAAGFGPELEPSFLVHKSRALRGLDVVTATLMVVLGSRCLRLLWVSEQPCSKWVTLAPCIARSFPYLVVMSFVPGAYLRLRDTLLLASALVHFVLAAICKIAGVGVANVNMWQHVGCCILAYAHQMTLRHAVWFHGAAVLADVSVSIAHSQAVLPGLVGAWWSYTINATALVLLVAVEVLLRRRYLSALMASKSKVHQQ